MMKKIGLLVVVLVLGASCSKEKNKDYAIKVNKGTSETTDGKKSGATSEEVKAAELAKAEEAKLAEAEKNHRVSEINDVLDRAVEDIEAQSDLGILIDGPEVTQALDTAEKELGALMESLTDPVTQMLVVERYEYDEKDPREEGLEIAGDEHIYVRTIEILDTKFDYLVGFRNVKAPAEAKKETSESTELTTDEDVIAEEITEDTASDPSEGQGE